MKKNHLFFAFVLIVLGAMPAFAQQPAGRWNAEWISCPDAHINSYGVYHFRHNFSLSDKPAEFKVHVSADNRYRLFVNGQYAGMGPARGDLHHYFYENYDIAPFLKQGENTIAAVVWNMGEYAPAAQQSAATAFWLQAEKSEHQIANTNKDWRVFQNTAYQPLSAKPDEVLGYFVAGPGDRVEASKYPYGWANPTFDDSQWKKARSLGAGTPTGSRWLNRWALTPRTIPPMEERPERFKKVVRFSGIPEINEYFIFWQERLYIPPNSQVKILIDMGHLTIGHPEMTTSGGKGARIKMIYAEALRDENNQKADRNRIEGMEIKGYSDIFLPDGGENRHFSPLWLRTFRYVQLEIITSGEALEINEFKNIFTAYPFEQKAHFETDDQTLHQIWDVGWRTARLCAGETYFDCPYYEQLQYVGDTRIQALISLYLTGDDRLMRQAITQLGWSQTPQGLTASRYPAKYQMLQVIPSFSIYWIGMIYDFYWHRTDTEFVKQFLPQIYSVISWFESRIDPENGLLAPLPHWNYCDWNPNWKHGVPPGAEDGNSALMTLHFLYGLQMAAELFEAFGKKQQAQQWQQLAENIKKSLTTHCFDQSKGAFTDTPQKNSFSQHVNIMAILTSTIPAQKQPALLEKVLSQKDWTQASIYYRFYLFAALRKTGMADRYLSLLGDWKTMLELNLTTFLESLDKPRSDCHAWSASPCYDFLATVCGITPASPGFKTVRIAPNPGSLDEIDAAMPHPRGKIGLKMKIRRRRLKAEVELPQGVTGNFVWEGESFPLKEGKQEIRIKFD